MDAGSLIHRVTIETSTEASDGHGGLVVTWAVVRRRMAAKVSPLAGRDLERARQIDPRASLEVTMRFWSAYRTELAGGRARLIFHDGGVSDRRLEIVEPPREIEHRVALAMIVREAA